MSPEIGLMFERKIVFFYMENSDLNVQNRTMKKEQNTLCLGVFTMRSSRKNVQVGTPKVGMGTLREVFCLANWAQLVSFTSCLAEFVHHVRR